MKEGMVECGNSAVNSAVNQLQSVPWEQRQEIISGIKDQTAGDGEEND